MLYAALHRTPLPDDIADKVVSEFHVDVQNLESLKALFLKYRDTIGCVWNLAAPLSVDTAKDPSAAYRITVGGMQNILEAMLFAGISKICFSDSIGSFGKSAPREGVSARWLLDCPDQDPGSDYGIQKRLCRNLLEEYSIKHGFDTRFVVIPGVLHSESAWGGGTTEYALDALIAAHKGEPYICPIPPHVRLPFIYIDDLVRGMISIESIPKENLLELNSGYNLAGFSASPEELFEEIRNNVPSFPVSYDRDRNPVAANFAQTWPDSLSSAEAGRDFDFISSFNLQETVRIILKSHRDRV
jgi:threonine 3-dehydrogenase